MSLEPLLLLLLLVAVAAAVYIGVKFARAGKVSLYTSSTQTTHASVDRPRGISRADGVDVLPRINVLLGDLHNSRVTNRWAQFDDLEWRNMLFGYLKDQLAQSEHWPTASSADRDGRIFPELYQLLLTRTSMNDLKIAAAYYRTMSSEQLADK
jgi:hypothetical protein